MTVDSAASPIRRLATSSAASKFALALAVLVVLNALFAAWTEAKRTPGVDFLVYWSVAQAVSSGEVADVYSPAGSAEITEEIATRAQNPYLSPRQRQAGELVLGYERNSVDVVATPFLFTTLSLFEHGDYDRDLSLFALVCLVLFAMAVAGLARAFGFDPPTTALLLLLFCIGFPPLDSDLRVGNVNQIQLFSLALVLWILRRPGVYRDVGAGAVLGLSLMFRPSVALVAVLLVGVWLVDRQSRRAAAFSAGAGAGAAVAVLISSAYFGTFAAWTNWLRVAPGLLQSKDERGKGGLEYGNYGLVAVIRRLLSFDASVGLLLLLLVVFAVVVWRGRGRTPPAFHGDPQFFRTAAAVSLGAAFVLLSSSLVWFHYVVMAIPAILLALAVAVGAGTAARVAALIGLLCLIRFPLEALSRSVTTQAVLVNVGIMTMTAVILAALAGGRTAIPPATAPSPARR